MTGMVRAYGAPFPTNAMARTGFRREASVSYVALDGKTSHCARGIDALAFARYVPRVPVGHGERKRRMSKLHRLDYKWIVAIAFILGIFMDILDTTIVNVALPAIAEDFGVNDSSIQWIVTGYLLSLAVWIPVSGWLGDTFGTKRVFIFALSAFTIGSVLCATAWNLEALIFFRVVQGIGGGMMTPVGSAMLFRAFPPNERAAASAVMVVPIAIAPATGPVLGGILVDQLSWHWIFLINIPIGIIGVIFCALMLRNEKQAAPGGFDKAGFILSATGLPILLYGISEGPTKGWGSTIVLGSIAIGVILLSLLVIVELRIPEPMLSLRLFGDRMFRNANLANFMQSAGLIGVLFLLPLLLQQLRGISATQSGLATFPQAIGVIAMSQVSTRLYPKVGPRRMMFVGGLGIAVLTAAFLLIDLETSLWWIRALMFTRGLFFSLSLVPIQAATYSTIKPADQGRASSLFQTNRQVASSVGVAILATVLAQQMTAHTSGATSPEQFQAGALSAYHDAFAIAVVLAILASFFSLLIHDEDAKASMEPVGTRTAPEEEPVIAH